MNPFDQKPTKSLEDMMLGWKDLSPRPYKKLETDPYTKARIILMNGIEVEAVMFGHNFNRNCEDNDLRRDLALMRRIEAGQQKHVNWLSPSDETPLETTIGYEQLAVDLTAWLAMHEPDAYAKSCMDFALLEDFDHLYRYANLLKVDEDLPAHELVLDTIEITPGRPTVAHHRHPFDSVRAPRNAKTADIRTILGALILTAGEQQTMNFYMNLGNTQPEGVARDLYLEIGMVEEEHVTHYGALLDPSATWLQNLLLREYMETYLYYSFYETEVDPYVKKIWEQHFEQEVGHLHKAADLLYKHENMEWQSLIPDGEFPELLDFHPTKDYVREVLDEQATLTAKEEEFVELDELPGDYRFFGWNDQVNGRIQNVPSHRVIREAQKKDGEDYRIEDQPSPVRALRNRKEDNTKLGRVQGSEHDSSRAPAREKLEEVVEREEVLA